MKSTVFSLFFEGFSLFQRKLARTPEVCVFVGLHCHLPCWCLHWLTIQDRTRAAKGLTALPVFAISLLSNFDFFSSSFSLRTFVLPDIHSSWGIFVLNLPLSFCWCYFFRFDSLTEKYVWTVVNVSSYILTFFWHLCVFCVCVCLLVNAASYFSFERLKTNQY